MCCMTDMHACILVHSNELLVVLSTLLSGAKADDPLLLLQGFVYLKFLNGDGASKAQAALNGRWFAGRQIAADFQFPAVYNNYFRL